MHFPHHGLEAACIQWKYSYTLGMNVDSRQKWREIPIKEWH